MHEKKKTHSMDWHSLFEGEHPIKNKAGLSDSGIRLLVRDLDYIGVVAPEYPGRVLRYVLDGEGDEVLQELELLDVYFKARHFAPLLRDKASREKLFVESASGAHDFLERLGRVYHALMNPLNPNFLMPARFQSPSWLEALLLHVSGSYSGDMRTYLQLKFIETLIIATQEGNESLIKTIFGTESFDYSSCEVIAIFFSLIDLPSVVEEHSGHVSQALGSENSSLAVQALNIINSFGISPSGFVIPITSCVLSKHNRMRSTARRIIRKSPDMFREPLKQVIDGASAEEKLKGIKFFGRLYGKTESAYLKDLLSRETSMEAKKAISLIIEENPDK